MITNADKSRFVAEKLEIAPTQRQCVGCYGNYGHIPHHHDVPLDLTAPTGADALMTAIQKRGWKTEQWESSSGVHYSIEQSQKDCRTIDEVLALSPEERRRFEYEIDSDWKVAQLGATWKMLGGSDDNQ